MVEFIREGPGGDTTVPKSLEGYSMDKGYGPTDGKRIKVHVCLYV